MLKIWNGQSETREEARYAAPDAADWQRICAEVIKTQRTVVENTYLVRGEEG